MGAFQVATLTIPDCDEAEDLAAIQAALRWKGFPLSTVRLLDYLIWLGCVSHRSTVG